MIREVHSCRDGSFVNLVFLSLSLPLPPSLPTQEHWSRRSKGLLKDFAYGQLSRLCQARARARTISGGDSQDEEENYDIIRGDTHSLSLPPPSLLNSPEMISINYVPIQFPCTLHSSL